MEDLDSTLKDLTPLLSKYMDASGSLDPSRAPPDMTVSSHTAGLLSHFQIACHGVTIGVGEAGDGGVMGCTGPPGASERISAAAEAGE